MKRIAWSIVYLLAGVVVSWQSMSWMSRLAQDVSWPLFNKRWHGCWDIEHCKVSAFGYGFILAFVFAPSVVWAITGFKQTHGTLASRALIALLLALGTLCFYLLYYLVVWH